MKNAFVMLNWFQHLKENLKDLGLSPGLKVRDDIRGIQKKSILIGYIVLCLLTIGSLAHAQQVTAGPYDTVYGLAWKLGVKTRDFVRVNGLKPPYTLYNGQVLNVPVPNEHIVVPGETPQSIAEEHGVNVDVLTMENGGAESIRPGNQLSIPSRDTEPMSQALQQPDHGIQTSSLAPLPLVKTAPVSGRTPAPVPAVGVGLPNELAEEIAREKGEKPADISPARVSGAESSKPMLMGNLTQRNAGAPTAATSSVAFPEENEVPAPKKIEKKPEKKPEKKKEKIAEKKEKPKGKDHSSADVEEEEKTEVKQPQFMWPVEGEVIAKFKPGKNDGIKIQVPEGTSVKAAAAGDVLYAGSELKGFGNLLLLKHAGGWVTAYAHNSSLLVKKGDKVKQGQVVAKSGKTGDIKVPQLHFEVRKGKQPVDPLAQLES